MSKKKILLTFDVEEFDIPLEYGHTVYFEQQIKISTTGLISILSLLEKQNIVCTFFTTAKYALENQSLIKIISEKHEIASHGFYHSTFEINDLKKSKITLEKIINKPVYGFRMARLAPVDEREIANAGYSYNSSMNPTWLPGRYNNFKKPRIPYYSDTLLNIPTSVTPIIRIPLFWLGFKNYPFALYKKMMLRTLHNDGLLSLYFHPWEFVDITGFNLPKYISKHSGFEMLKRLDNSITLLKREADFITMQEYASHYKD